MRPGLYVQHQGATYQVANIAASYTPGPHGLPQPASVYYLRPLDGGALVFATNPPLELTPACGVCNLPAGYSTCVARGSHDGAAQQSAPAASNGVPARCACGLPDCSYCVRLARAAGVPA